MSVFVQFVFNGFCGVVVGLVKVDVLYYVVLCGFFQAEDGIRDLVRSRGLGDVYKRQDG